MNKLLTIVIPTRDRRSNLLRQLMDLQNLFVRFSTFEGIDVLVSDNSRQEILDWDQEATLFGLDFRNRVNYVKQESYFETTEEHILHLLPIIDAEYVWFLSDDDVVVKEAFLDLYLELSKGEVDFLVWNSGILHPSMNRVLTSHSDGLEDYNDVNLLTISAQIGYRTHLAAISTQVYRTKKMSVSVFEQVINECGPIYSHVAALMYCFRESRCRFKEIPLIQYRLNKNRKGEYQGAWERYAEQSNNPIMFPWTIGFFKQILWLQKTDVIPSDYFKFMWHRAYSHSSNKIEVAPLLKDVVVQTFDLLLHQFGNSDSRRCHNEEIDLLIESFAKMGSECSTVVSWLNLLKFYLHDVTIIPDEKLQLILERLKFDKIAYIINSDVNQHFFFGYFLNWTIYHNIQGYFAVETPSGMEMKDHLCLLTVEKSETVLFSDSIAGLSMKIVNRSEQQEFVGSKKDNLVPFSSFLGALYNIYASSPSFIKRLFLLLARRFSSL